jgi:hypothetical protein
MVAKPKWSPKNLKLRKNSERILTCDHFLEMQKNEDNFSIASLKSPPFYTLKKHPLHSRPYCMAAI